MNPFTDAEMRWLGEIGHQLRQATKGKAKDMALNLTQAERELMVDWLVYRISGKRPAKPAARGPKAKTRQKRDSFEGRELQPAISL